MIIITAIIIIIISLFILGLKSAVYKIKISKNRIKSESPPTTLIFVHSTKTSTHNDTIKLSFHSF